MNIFNPLDEILFTVEQLEMLSGIKEKYIKKQVGMTAHNLVPYREAREFLKKNRLKNNSKKNKMRKISKVISVLNNKGGVGKSFISFNLSTTLHLLGYDVLVIDGDNQNNFTSMFLEKELYQNNQVRSLYDLYLKDNSEIEDFVFELSGGLFLLPGNKKIETIKDLFAPSSWLKRVAQGEDLLPEGAFSKRELKLKTELDRIKSHFDFIIIDSCPSLDRSNRSIYVASDKIIVPSKGDRFSYDAIPQVMAQATVSHEEVGSSFDPIEDVYILFNMIMKKSKSEKVMIDKIKSEFPKSVLPEEIMYRSDYEDAMYEGVPIWGLEEGSFESIRSIVRLTEGIVKSIIKNKVFQNENKKGGVHV